MAFAPACSGSLQLGVAMSHAMGTSQTLPIRGVFCMDLNPKQYLQKTDLNLLQVIKRRFAPKNMPDCAAIAEDGPH